MVLAAITYSGRMLAASDLNELRETDVRDMFGFLNWLVIGEFIGKLAGNAISGGEILKEKTKFQGGGPFKKAIHIIKNKFFMTEGEIRSIFPAEKAAKLLKQRNYSIAIKLLYSLLCRVGLVTLDAYPDGHGIISILVIDLVELVCEPVSRPARHLKQSHIAGGYL